MKKNIRLISIAVCLIYIFMLFPSIFVFAATDSKAYSDGYGNGLWDGMDAAYDDLEDAKRKNYSKAMMSEKEIRSYYDLDKETTAYARDFIRGYKEGFREGYNTTYDNPKFDVTDLNYDELIGFEMGKAAGYSDFYAGKNNRWANAVPGANKIVQMFGLGKETNSYKNSFIKNFKSNYQEGYEIAYREAKYEPFLSDLERGEKDGEQIGGLVGANYGKKDYFDKKAIQWDRDLPSDSEIIKTFTLNKDVLEYEKSFVSAFKKYYREEYEEAYRNANLEYQSLLFKNGYESGKILGMSKGISAAKIDYMMGKPNSIDKHNFTNENIIVEYNLNNENIRYRDGFIGGFNEGFKSGYIETYQQNFFYAFADKVAEEIIPLGGGQVNSGDAKLNITIANGTFYNDVILSIDQYLQNKNQIDLPGDEQFIKSSHLYSIKIDNPYDKFDKDKMIELSLEYYGGLKGGIYRFHYGKWLYIPTRISENKITAYISPKTIQERAIYGVFIDENAINPLDTRGHWARDEIITSLRRGYTGLYNDNTFRPDVNLTKIQLLLYLNKANNWNIELRDNDIKLVESLKDYKDYKGVKDIVAYSIKEGFLGISDGNRFRPNSSITYFELEKIIKKVYENDDFRWKWVEEKMAVVKDKRCSSADSMNNNITRAEFAYLLNLLSE